MRREGEGDRGSEGKEREKMEEKKSRGSADG
jgi:hypothetical protein